MASIQQRTDAQGRVRYRVLVRLKGYPVQTATFDRKTDAKRWIQHVETEMRAGRYLKTQASMKHTVAEMIERYRSDVLPQKSSTTQGPQDTQLRWWAEELGHLLISDVSPSVVVDARDQLTRSDTKYRRRRSPSTVVRYLAALSHCFTIAIKEWGWAEKNPVSNVTKPSEPNRRVRLLSDEERNRLLEACRESRNRYLYSITVLALSTGMRKSEILGLTWDRVDFDRGMVVLRPEHTKNNDGRAVPLAGRAREELRKLADDKIRPLSNLVFPAPSSPEQPVDIVSAWRSAIERAQIEDFRFHDLRHSAASYLLMSGATLGELAEVLGHKTLQMVKRYSHLSDQHASKLVERMNVAVFGE
jgi:integrase